MRLALPMFNGMAPAEFSKGIPVPLDGSASYELDFVQELEQRQLSFIQSVYVDNYDNPNALTLYFGDTQQRIVVAANTFGVFPVLSNGTRVLVTSTAGDWTGILIFLNVPLPYFVWPNAAGGGGATPVEIVVADGLADAADVVMTGAALTVLAADPLRVDALIVAPPTNAAVIRVGNIATVAAGRGVAVYPGASVTIQVTDEIAAIGTAPDILTVAYTHN